MRNELLYLHVELRNKFETNESWIPMVQLKTGDFRLIKFRFFENS